MLEPRIYRAALLPALLAVAVVMFAVAPRPEPVRSSLAPDGFDGLRAAALDKQLLKAAPERTPGSRDDAAAAAFVLQRFRQVEGGQVAEQRFNGTFGGADVTLRNVSLVLPGRSDRRVVLVAPRDCAAGPCAVSSGAATAA